MIEDILYLDRDRGLIVVGHMITALIVTESINQDEDHVLKTAKADMMTIEIEGGLSQDLPLEKKSR